MVTHLRVQDTVVRDVRSLITNVLDPLSIKYPRWRDMMLLALRRYALDDHVLTNKIEHIGTTTTRSS
jgi:hypothetical protein